MNLSQIAELAQNLMRQHGLHDWRFQFDNAKRRAGLCSYRRKTIQLSKHFCLMNSEEEILDTILHEIAHAIVGPGHGHDRVWKQACVKIGAQPVRCYCPKKVTMPEGSWQATCPGCGKLFSKHRKPKLNLKRWCKNCGPDEGRLYYKKYAIVDI